jgi:peroxiredoxin
MFHRRTVLSWLVFACPAIVLIALPGCDPPPPEGREVGNQAPEIVGADINGTPVRLSEFRGKVVLINFWATWCPPCRSMIPHEREMVEQKYKGRPFVLLGVALDSPETLKQFFATNPMPWPNIVDEHRLVARQWEANHLPSLALVDHKGVILQKWTGAATEEIWAEVAKAVANAEAP